MHRGKVDHETPVAHCAAAHVVAAASDGEEKVALPGEVDCLDYVRDPGAPCNQRRPLVDQTVPDPPRPVIAVVFFTNEGSAKPARERVKRARTQLGGPAINGSEGWHARLRGLMRDVDQSIGYHDETEAEYTK